MKNLKSKTYEEAFDEVARLCSRRRFINWKDNSHEYPESLVDMAEVLSIVYQVHEDQVLDQLKISVDRLFKHRKEQSMKDWGTI